MLVLRRLHGPLVRLTNSPFHHLACRPHPSQLIPGFVSLTHGLFSVCSFKKKEERMKKGSFCSRDFLLWVVHTCLISTGRSRNASEWVASHGCQKQFVISCCHYFPLSRNTATECHVQLVCKDNNQDVLALVL